MKNILPTLTLALLFSGNAFSSCASLTTITTPEISKGHVSTASEMYKFQAHVKEYIQLGEEVLSCTQNSIKYNFTLSKMKNAAETYNHELRIFKEKERSIMAVL